MNDNELIQYATSKALRWLRLSDKEIQEKLTAMKKLCSTKELGTQVKKLTQLVGSNSDSSAQENNADTKKP